MAEVEGVACPGSCVFDFILCTLILIYQSTECSVYSFITSARMHEAEFSSPSVSLFTRNDHSVNICFEVHA